LLLTDIDILGSYENAPPGGTLGFDMLSAQTLETLDITSASV